MKIQYIRFHLNALHHPITLHYITLQCVTLHCNAFQCIRLHYETYSIMTLDYIVFLDLNNPNTVGQSTAGAFNILRPDRMLLRLHSLKDIFWWFVSRLGILSLERETTARFPTLFTMGSTDGSQVFFYWGKAELG